uniref:C2H2-type domain-containing protein n=1 Tax=viral metagenome TaxID=1070528 RepID=A0A6C0DNH8_9ZZZZ
MDLEQKNVKKRKNYNCDICAFVSSNKFDYDRHILTRKHINNANSNHFEPKNAKKRNLFLQHVCSQCNKKYNSKSGLWSHKKKCTIVDQENPDESTNTFTPELFIEILKENKEIQNVLIEQNKQLQNKLLEKDNVLIEQNNKIIELASKQVSNITNNNTTNNTQFNLQFFLNETCKNAMNITDFVNSLQVQIADIEKTGKLGYVEGISGILLRGLRELDYTMRPIHCTDLKRETVYVKDENSWEKDDDEKAKLKLAIQRVARKNMRTLPKWQEENPDFRILDTKENDDYLKIALNSMGGQTDTEHEKYVDKIMRNVIKEVVIEKK